MYRFPLFRHLTKRVSCMYIIVPYLQIVAVTGRLRLEWPPWLISTFSAFSVLNLNLGLTLHWCYFGLGFENEWYLYVLMPIFWVLGILIR